MAGSDEFKSRLSQAERNRQGRERKSNDPEILQSRLAKVDRTKYDVSGYSDKEISMALQGNQFGDEDYARLTGRSLDNNEGGNEVNETVAAAAAPEPEPTAPVAEIGGNYRPEVFGGGGVDTDFGDDGSSGGGYGPGFDGSFNVGGDLTQTIGKQGDMNTTIGDNNTFGTGLTLGVDNSVTTGTQSAGNSFGRALNDLRQAKAQAGAFASSAR